MAIEEWLTTFRFKPFPMEVEGGGITVFFFDFLMVFLGVTSVICSKSPQISFVHRRAVSAFYHALLLILPFILWIIPTYRELEDLWSVRKEVSALGKRHHCPICGKEKAGIMDHIRSSHGEKSTEKRKVKKFLSRNPELLP